jgi:hypothetical protein
VESVRNPCGIIHAEFARMLTCKLDMQSVRTSTESTRTNTESVQTNTESVCTFAGKVGICTESAESVWSVRNLCGPCGIRAEHLGECKVLRKGRGLWAGRILNSTHISL